LPQKNNHLCEIHGFEVLLDTLESPGVFTVVKVGVCPTQASVFKPRPQAKMQQVTPHAVAQPSLILASLLKEAIYWAEKEKEDKAAYEPA
jgi:hypothetical protein